jgi:hypothetical protein
VRDRIIDDETGDLVYAYPLEIEQERLRRKLTGGGVGGEGGEATGMQHCSSRQSCGEERGGGGGGLESGSSTPRVRGEGEGGHVASGGQMGVSDWLRGAGMKLGGGVEGGTVGGRSRGGGEGVGAGGGGGGVSDDSRTINREIREKSMPALVNGVLVLTAARTDSHRIASGCGGGHASHASGGVGGERDRGDVGRGGGAHVSRGAERETKGGDLGGVGVSRSGGGGLPRSRSSDEGQDLGAWGAVAENRSRLPATVVAPSIWSDDDECLGSCIFPLFPPSFFFFSSRPYYLF